MAAGTWNLEAAGDAKARPAPRKNNLTGVHLRKVDNSLKRKIKKKLDNDPFLTPHGLQRLIPGLRVITKRTICRIIQKELGIPSRIAAAKPFLTDAQKLRRLDWAKKHEPRSQTWWRKVLWSDETHIELWKGSRYCHNIRRSSTVSRYASGFIRRTQKHPAKLMIWGAFGNGKLGDLYFVEHNQKMNAPCTSMCSRDT